jgi:hypothetical protein
VNGTGNIYRAQDRGAVCGSGGGGVKDVGGPKLMEEAKTGIRIPNIELETLNIRG